MASYKLANYIILRNFTARNKCSSSLIVTDRHFCSKENDIRKGSNSNEDDSSKEKEKVEKSVKAKETSPKDEVKADMAKVAAKQKLMSLLSGIKITSDKPVKSSLNLAKPLKRISKKERLKQMEEKIITPQKKMDMALKAVASTFKEDSEKIESELAAKVSSLKLSEPEPTEKSPKVEESELDTEINENLMSSVKEVADTISESPIPTRSELTQRLMRLSLDKKLPAAEKKSMRSLIKGMAIQPQKPAEPPKKTAPMRQMKKLPAPKKIGRVNVFDGAPLNIFTLNEEAKTDSTNILSFWSKLQEREMRLLTQFAPANAFEEMILWTEQGKHWKFPIDNEAEMGVEEKIGFHEHVFLEHHLKGFPTKGPIRHFMELVVVGLSKNPYITIERKKIHIEWFRTYFKEKEEILRDEGCLD